MATGKRNRKKNSVIGTGKCMNLKTGKCKHEKRRGTLQCAKNRCCDFKDPKNPKYRK